MSSVLLVDDEPLIRKMLSRELGKNGLEVTCAANGLDAWLLARDADYDVVLTDVRMPLMGGLELLTALRQELPQVPVILMSGSCEVHDRDEALERGAFEFLPKPVPLSVVVRTVRTAAEWRTSQASAALAELAVI